MEYGIAVIAHRSISLIMSVNPDSFSSTFQATVCSFTKNAWGDRDQNPFSHNVILNMFFLSSNPLNPIFQSQLLPVVIGWEK